MASSDHQYEIEAGLEKPTDALASVPLQPHCKDSKQAPSSFTWRIIGPGLLACLADMDAGCLMVGAQSGADWNYSLMPLQILLVPVFFFAQELTIRLGVHTKMGHAACIKKNFGSFAAYATTGMLAIECVLAMISEMSGIAAALELWGLSRAVGSAVAAFMIISIVVGCNYRQIEKIGILFGLFEMTFVITMFLFHPPPAAVFDGMRQSHFHDKEYLELYAANIGAVIMPFMIYFQQSAVIARRLTVNDIPEERTNTFFGSCLSQLVMIGTVVTYAASRAKNLGSIEDMHLALVPVLGFTLAKVMISLALIGGSLCASFVVSLGASWAICDVVGWDDTYSLDQSPTEAPRFYGCFFAVIGIGFAVLQTKSNLVELNVFIDLLDGLLMPVAIGFLFSMACSDLLPENARVKGSYKALLGIVFTICACVSLTTGIAGLLKQEPVARRYRHLPWSHKTIR